MVGRPVDALPSAFRLVSCAASAWLGIRPVPGEAGSACRPTERAGRPSLRTEQRKAGALLDTVPTQPGSARRESSWRVAPLGGCCVHGYQRRALIPLASLRATGRSLPPPSQGQSKRDHWSCRRFVQRPLAASDAAATNQIGVPRAMRILQFNQAAQSILGTQTRSFRQRGSNAAPLPSAKVVLTALIGEARLAGSALTAGMASMQAAAATLAIDLSRRVYGLVL